MFLIFPCKFLLKSLSNSLCPIIGSSQDRHEWSCALDKRISASITRTTHSVSLLLNDDHDHLHLWLLPVRQSFRDTETPLNSVAVLVFVIDLTGDLISVPDWINALQVHLHHSTWLNSLKIHNFFPQSTHQESKWKRKLETWSRHSSPIYHRLQICLSRQLELDFWPFWTRTNSGCELIFITESNWNGRHSN